MREDVRRARATARIIMGLTLAMPPLLLLFLWVAAPAGPSPMFYERPWYVTALPWAGWAGWLFGLGWMIRIYRSNPEPGERTWRYRVLPLAVRLGSRPDGRRGREIARAMIIFAASFIPLALFYLVARPGFMGGGMFPPRYFGLTLEEVSLIVGFGGMVVGLAWMIRIYRANLEPGETTWRYRS